MSEGYGRKEYQKGHARKIYISMREKGLGHVDAMIEVRKRVYQEGGEDP